MTAISFSTENTLTKTTRKRLTCTPHDAAGKSITRELVKERNESVNNCRQFSLTAIGRLGYATQLQRRRVGERSSAGCGYLAVQRAVALQGGVLKERQDSIEKDYDRFSKMPAAPMPPPTHMVTIP
jgi:hypothetical protein